MAWGDLPAHGSHVKVGACSLTDKGHRCMGECAKVRVLEKK